MAVTLPGSNKSHKINNEFPKEIYMKFNILTIISFSFLSAVLITSCIKNTNSNNCLSYQFAPVSNISGPVNGAVNQDINFILSFDIFNGCGQFGNIEESSIADTTTIKVNAKYQGCICTQVAGTLQKTYIFRTAQPGTYYFKFHQGNGNYLLHTLIVQ